MVEPKQMAYFVHCGGKEAERTGLGDEVIRDDFATEWLLRNAESKGVVPWLRTIEDDHIPGGKRIIWIGGLASDAEEISRAADGRSDRGHIANDDIENSRCGRTGVFLEIDSKVSRIEFEDFANALFLFRGDRGKQTTPRGVDPIGLILHEVVPDRTDFRISIGSKVGWSPNHIRRAQRAVFLDIAMSGLLAAAGEIQLQRIGDRADLLLEDRGEASSDRQPRIDVVGAAEEALWVSSWNIERNGDWIGYRRQR